MIMAKKAQFKTNINCGGCIATVTPFLDESLGEQEWSVDTTHKDKVLAVAADKKEAAIAAVKAAGFTIEPLKKGLFGKLL